MDIRPNMTFSLTLKGIDMLSTLETHGRESDNIGTRALGELFYGDRSPSDVSRRLGEPLSRSQIAFRVLYEKGYIEPASYGTTIAPETLGFGELEGESLRSRFEAPTDRATRSTSYPIRDLGEDSYRGSN